MEITKNDSKLVKVQSEAQSKFNSEGYWNIPISDISSRTYPDLNCLDLFDQNGYDLTELEKLYASCNDTEYFNHREHRFSIKKEWYKQEPKPIQGPVLNHCYLFERKGYNGEALKQLKEWEIGRAHV